MNFTSDIKKEIMNRGVGITGKAAEKKSAISAFIRTSGAVGINDGTPTFFIVSETERVAEFFMSTFWEVFETQLFITRATMDKRSGRDKLLLQCPKAKAADVVKGLAFVDEDGGICEGIPQALINEDGGKIAYIQGAFLGGGSCTVPSEGAKTGYHLEIVFFEEETANDFCSLLEEFELLAKSTKRKDTWVVYIKSKELISDFLSVIGAEHSLSKFSMVVDKRDRANNKNRAQNCMAGNADKAAIAAVKQVVAIRKLQESGIFGELGGELQQLARLRIQNPEKSLQELADYLKVSKSCLNHRMRKLIELAGGEEEKTNKRKKL